MKKLVFGLLALVLMSGAAFAERGVINLKVGYDAIGNMGFADDSLSGTIEDIKDEKKGNTNGGFSVAGEYLFKVSDALRLGAGVEYVLPRKFDDNSGEKFSYLPVYLSAELTPIPSLRDFYLKGNFGYSVMADIDTDMNGFDCNGGIYFAAGAGLSFDFGLFVEALCGIYYSEWDFGFGTLDIRYIKAGVNAGFRFDI